MPVPAGSTPGPSTGRGRRSLTVGPPDADNASVGRARAGESRIKQQQPWTQHLLRWGALVSVFTTAVVLTGGTLVWLAERHASGANLRHWGDAAWWAVTTLTTVGYGEHYPVTLLGRLVAVCIMAAGVAIIGAVAAIVAYAFAGRLATRLEEAVRQVEHQVEHVGEEVEEVEAEVSGRRPGPHRGALQEIVVGVADADTADSLTWLLARLGWHPAAGDDGIGWRAGAVLLRIAVRPWDAPVGIQGRLTFGAGSPERLARITRESGRHGFHAVHVVVAPDGSLPAGHTGPVTLRTHAGFEVVLTTS